MGSEMRDWGWRSGEGGIGTKILDLGLESCEMGKIYRNMQYKFEEQER